MNETVIKLTEGEFVEQYPLAPNHLNPTATWVVGDGGGCLFETYGPELEFINRQDLRRIWTLVEGDDGDLYVVSGFHFVNRLGYLLSYDTVPDMTSIQVRIPARTGGGDW